MTEKPVVFLDTETTGLIPGVHELWEIGYIMRGPQGWVEYLWQFRPESLRVADTVALQIGGYFARCKAPRGRGRAESTAAKDLVVHLGERAGAESASLVGDDARSLAPEALAGIIAEHLDGVVIVGANPHFDAQHLDAFLRAHGSAPSWSYRLENIGSRIAGFLAAQGVEVAPGSSSMDCYVALGLADPAVDSHTALGDARIVKRAWDMMEEARGQVG